MAANNQIIAGFGFSSDTQQITDAQCYNVVNSTNSPTTTFHLQEAVTFDDIQKVFGISVNVGLNFGLFSSGSTVSYLRQMEEKDYSLSLNYYETATATVKLEPTGYGPKGFLNEIGAAVYNNGSNPYFGVACGDQFVTDYQVGAILAMGINIELESNYQKQQFISASGGSLGDIFSASVTIENIAQSLSLNGQISMNAFQIGGEPQYLSEVLQTNSTGGYYISSCSIQSMNSCVKAAEGLLNYAKNNFTQQFSFNPAHNLYQIKYQFDYQPAIYFGVTPPASLVTPEVIAARKALANALFENQYYDQKFTELYASYPIVNISPSVKMQFSDNFDSNIKSLWNVVKNNLEILTNTDDPEMSAISCYDQPQSCPQIANGILSSLQQITEANITALNLDQIQYYYTSPIDQCGGNPPDAKVAFYYTGDQWGYINDSDICDHVHEISKFVINGTFSEVTFQTFSWGGCLPIDTKNTVEYYIDYWIFAGAEALANGNIQFNSVNTDAGWACNPTIFYQYEFPVQIEPFQPDLA